MKGFKEDPKALTPFQFFLILQEIERHHSFGKPGHINWIKYVRPDFDMRDGKCFHIKLDEVSFSSDDAESSMFEDIMAYLKRDTTGAVT